MTKSNVASIVVRPKRSKRLRRKIDEIFEILRDYIIPLYFVYEVIKHFLMKGRERQKAKPPGGEINAKQIEYK